MRHGFPYQPSSMAFDPVQKILAIGTQTGALRLYPFSHVKSHARKVKVYFLKNKQTKNTLTHTVVAHMCKESKSVSKFLESFPGTFFHLSCHSAFHKGTGVHRVNDPFCLLSSNATKNKQTNKKRNLQNKLKESEFLGLGCVSVQPAASFSWSTQAH